MSSDVRVWVQEKNRVLSNNSNKQILARAVGSVERPVRVFVYEVKNGFVESKTAYLDWNCVKHYPDCFVDCNSAGEFEIGQLVGHFPIMYQ
jgi:hypothetical protein